ncbi:MAG TPA: hypothetical protein VGB13_03390 [Candidatus Krumholzibacteria bacterium]
MNRRLFLACSFAAVLNSAAFACSVGGCEPDDGQMPRMRFRLLDAFGQQLALFDSSTDESFTLPNFLRTPTPDGSFVIEYLGADRREAYGEVEQTISIQFSDLLPPDKMSKHPEGRAEQVPVGCGREVVNWTGRATFLTVYGVLEDAEGAQPCSWFCRFDIDWIGTFPDARPSLSRVKALY